MKAISCEAIPSSFTALPEERLVTIPALCVPLASICLKEVKEWQLRLGSFCDFAWFSPAPDWRLAVQSAEQGTQPEQPIGRDAFAPTVLKQRGGDRDYRFSTNRLRCWTGEPLGGARGRAGPQPRR
jgi:hypothetical protein